MTVPMPNFPLPPPGTPGLPDPEYGGGFIGTPTMADIRRLERRIEELSEQLRLRSHPDSAEAQVVWVDRCNETHESEFFPDVDIANKAAKMIMGSLPGMKKIWLQHHRVQVV